MKPKISLVKNFHFTIVVSIKNSMQHIFGGKASFFVLFYCHVRRYPKTAFHCFKKKNLVYFSTSNIFKSMNYWIFSSIWDRHWSMVSLEKLWKFWTRHSSYISLPFFFTSFQRFPDFKLNFIFAGPKSSLGSFFRKVISSRWPNLHES